MADDDYWLPNGFHGYWWEIKPPEKEKPLTKTCSCGSNITMGYEAPSEFHSDWCDLKEKKNDNGT